MKKKSLLRCVATILIVATPLLWASKAAAVENQPFTYGTAQTCANAACSKWIYVSAMIPGASQYEQVCRQLWSAKPYVFPYEEFSYGSPAGSCLNHRTYQPDAHLVFATWTNLYLPDPKNNGPSCPSCGNPINPATANKFQVELDYAAPAPSPLRFQRIY